MIQTLYSQEISSSIPIEISIIDKIGNESLDETEVILLETGKRYTSNGFGKIYPTVPKLGTYNLRILGSEKIDKRKIDVRYPNQKFN
ncbi:MAG: hypothetical protein GW761_06930, partial [Leptospira sp.]|nr:hypothetical protein [Leptospira sp.]